jgi:hypothetical protein
MVSSVGLTWNAPPRLYFRVLKHPAPSRIFDLQLWY